MSMIFEESVREISVKAVAQKMMLAARTAPKARGKDNLIIALAEKDEIEKIATFMRKLASTNEAASFFIRDAENISKAEILFLIGTKIAPLGLDCGFCGVPSCQEKLANTKLPCAFNTGDLGIALGSAVSIATDHRIDNRIMFSVGIAARELGLLGKDAAICFGVPLSVSGKNVFFDRK